jgi:TolB-like protein/DNA-binding winged helix-turn-helix (wHTH) protein/tetratricopeptide (TPR) repeat protein
MTGGVPTTRCRFGVFEIDTASGELWKQGRDVRLQGKPLEVLTTLLERRGQVVSRKELQERLWPSDTFVEFETGLNNAISRLRQTLGDSAESPRFIETIPKRGYRFIAPVLPVASAVQAVDPLAPVSVAAPYARANTRSVALVTGLAVLALVALLAYREYRPRSVPPLRSLAVLPFATGGTDDAEDHTYVAFGVTDALISELSRDRALRVISQTSAQAYREHRKPLPQIARELGVSTIVEGSVVNEGAQVRVTVQLIDASSDTHLLTRVYRRDASEILAAHDEVARAAASDIRSFLTHAPEAPPSVTARVDPRVREAHLKGRYFLSQGTESGRLRGLTFFEEALAIDPSYAPSHAGVADFYILTDSVASQVAIPRARTHALRAIELEPSLADAHASLAYLYYYGDWNWTAAEQAFQRALDLDPAHTHARRRYGMFLSAMGKHDRAIEQVQRVLEIDPLSVPALDSAAQVWLHARNGERLLQQGRKILEISPSSPQAYEHETAGRLLLKDYPKALIAATAGLERSKGDPLFLVLRGYVEGALGNEAASKQTLAELQQRATKGFIPPFFLAVACLGARQFDQALEWLERGYAAQDTYMVFIRSSPFMDPIREDPRFQDLLRRMKFPQQ